MKLPRSIVPWVALIAMALCAAVPLPARAQPMHDLPVYVESVEKAVSAENLRAVAATTEEPEVLLGLAYLVRPGDPLRAELAERAVAAKPEYAAPAAVIAVMMDGPNEQNVAALLERDPENALGHYLEAILHYRTDREDAALTSFRRAAELRELRLYLTETSEALFAALDALGLEGRDRLAALSWMATRVYNFGSMFLQPIHQTLSGLAREMDNAGRREISDLLIVYAGHIFRTNFDYRTYGRWALESAFRMKAEVAAAEGSLTMHGYAAVTQALVSTSMGWPEIEGGPEVAEVAQFLPNRISFAFARIGPREPELYNVKRDVPEADRPAFEQARQAAIEASEAMVAAAEKDPDALIGAYLRGVPESRTPWASPWTPVDVAMEQFPDVYRAAVAYEAASDALTAAGQGDPRQRNFGRLMPLGLGAVTYAFEHDRQFPPNLEALYEAKLVDPEVEARSVFTGRPYAYVAAGERMPEKAHDATRFIVLYDDHEIDGTYQVMMADGHGEQVPVEQVREQLRARGK